MSTAYLVKNLEGILKSCSEKPIQGPVDLLIQDGSIKQIGSNINKPDAEILSGEGCIAIPGLVNTHHHFFQFLTRAIPRMQNEPLFSWLVDHYDVWAGIDPEAVYWSSAGAIAELMLTGCTLTTDHHYLFPNNHSSGLIDMQFKAAEDLGIRFLATRGSMSLSRSKGGLPPDNVVQTEDEILKDSQSMIVKYHDPSANAMKRVALAPCSPFSVTEELMKQSVQLARSYRVKIHTHLAETIDEENFCISKYGCRPVELMAKWNWLGPDVWFAHCVHLNESEIIQFAETQTGVAHCPSSNMRLGSGIAPIAEMVHAGVPVGLAVDGSASNDSSDMLSEVRQAFLLQRVLKGPEVMTAYQALDIATRGGARLLGFDNLGTIQTGNPADVAIFRVNRIDFSGVHDPFAGLVFAGNCHRANIVFVNGVMTVFNQELVNLKEQTIIANTRRISRNLVDRAETFTHKNYMKAPEVN